MAKSIARGAPSASTAADNDMFTIHTRIFVQATAIKANTQLLNSMGVESVPFIIAKNVATGQVVTNTGALQTADLAKFLGLDAP